MRARFLSPLISAGCVALGLFSASGLAAEKRNVNEMPVVFAEAVTAPRLAELDTAFHAQADAWNSGCQSIEPLRGAFNDASDAWARMEMFASGPLVRQSRRERIAYWPDPRNAVTRGISALMQGEGQSGLSPQDIEDASVAVQGLPALERLLFSQSEQGGNTDALSERACAVGRAIARNLSAIVSGALTEWKAPQTGDLDKLRAGTATKGAADAATSAVLGDLVTGLRILDDRKVPPLYGGKGVLPNEKKAESWRSHRSERDLLMNIKSLQAALDVLRPFAPEATVAANEKLAAAAAALQGKEDQNRGVTVIAAINNATYYVVEVLPSELGVALGFNSLDGD